MAVVCGRCSHWEVDQDGKKSRVDVTHPSPAAVKLCFVQANRDKKDK